MKKAIALFLTLAMMLSLTPAVLAADSGQADRGTQLEAVEVPGESLLDDMESSDSDRVNVEPLYDDNEIVTVIVQLEDPALMDYYGTSAYSADNGMTPGESVSAFLGSSAAQSAAQDLLDEQEMLANQIAGLSQDGASRTFSAQPAGAEVVAQWTALLNGMAVEVPYKMLDEIRALDGVKRAYVARTFAEPDEPVTDAGGIAGYSYDMVHLQEVWDAGYTGKGMLVAVLDTGLDLDWRAYESTEGSHIWSVHEAFTDNSFKSADAKENLRYNSASLASFLLSNSLNAETRGGETEVTYEFNALYKNLKVPFAYDYADLDLNVLPSESDHGTHVAGTAAGYSEDEEGVVEFSGVAPDAQILAMKVFGDATGSAAEPDILSALEDAVKLGADVVNLSLGSDNGFAEDDTAANDVYAAAEEAGIILMTSSGNSAYSSSNNNRGGYNLSSDPEISMMSSPAVYDSNLAVASINSTVAVEAYFTWTDEDQVEHRVVYNDPTGVAMKYKFAGQEPVSIIPVSGAGTEQDYYDAGFRNYYGYGEKGVSGIALVQRGGEDEDGEPVTFADKINNATRFTWNYYDSSTGTNVSACPVQAVIVYDNVEGELVTMSVDGTALTSCFISKADGEAIVEAIESGYDVKITVQEEDRLVSWDQAGEMSEFSSWGAGPGLELKPEITAPGGNIWSSITGGSSADGSTGSYGMMSGTSMASPHMTGIGALVEQYVRTKGLSSKQDIADLTSRLLVSTAIPQKDGDGVYYSPRLQGAGLVNAGAAISTPAYITVDGESVGKLEFYDDPAWTGSYDFAFQVNNMTANELTYDVQAVFLRPDTSTDGEHTYILDSDVVIKTADLGSVTVPAMNSSAFSSASFSGNAALTGEEIEALRALFPNGTYVEGYVILTPRNGTDPQLGLPFLSFLGDWTAAPIFDATTWLDAAETDSGSYFDNDYTWQPIVFGYYDGYGFYNLGQNIFDGTSGQEQTVYHEGNVTLAPGSGVFQSINDIIIYQLRSAKLLVVEARDAETGELYYRDLATYQLKTTYDASYGYPIPYSLRYFTDTYWGGTDLEGNVLPSGTECVYTITAYGEGDYGDTVYNEEAGRYVSDFEAVDPTDPATEPTFNGHAMDKTGDVISFHVLVDTEAPRLENNAVSIYEEDGRTYLTGTFVDDGSLALVQVAPVVTRTSKYNPDYSDTAVATGDSFFTEYIYDEASHTYTFVADVTEYTHNESYPGESAAYDFTWTGAVYIYGGDYGGNERVYAVSVDEGNKTPDRINLSQTSALLYVGDSFDLSVVDNTGTDEELIYTSSNPEVAVIDEAGSVIALAPGQTVITVSNSSGSAVCVVAVREHTTEVLDFKLSIENFSGMKPNGALLVKVTDLYPADVQLEEIRWEVSESDETAEVYEGLITCEQYSSDGLSGMISLNYSATGGGEYEGLDLSGEGTLTVTLNGVSRTMTLDWESLYNQSTDEDLVPDIGYNEQIIYVSQGETATLVTRYNDAGAHNVGRVGLYTAEGYSEDNQPTTPAVGLVLDGPDFFYVGSSEPWTGKLVNEAGYALPEEIHMYYRYSSGHEVELTYYEDAESVPSYAYAWFTYDSATGEITAKTPTGSDNILAIRADGVADEDNPGGTLSGETYEEVEPLYGPFDWAATPDHTLTGELTTAEGVLVNNITKNVAYYTPSEPGVSYITATTKDGKYSCNFAVVCMPIDAERIDMEHSLTMKTGETLSPDVTFEPQPTLAEDEELIWTSYNPDVVTVDEDGTLTAQSVGYAYIRAATRANSSVATYCIVRVVPGGEHDHQLVLINEKEATCTEPGYSGDWQCTICGEIVSEGSVVEPLGHNRVLEGYIAPSATEDGYSGDWVCSRCGILLERGEVLPATGIPVPELPNPSYPPEIADADNGSVTVAPTNPKRGSEVTITVQPEPGYEVGTVTVTDRNGSRVDVTANPDGTYSFIQPGSRVTVTVDFVAAAEVEMPFTDVSGGWYHDAVQYVYENGLMQGVGDGLFGPALTTDRAMIATILWRMEGEPVVDYAMDYADVAGGVWYTEAIRWAASQGIVTGYGDSRFGPADAVTREQLAVILYRYAGAPAADASALDSFSDRGQVSSWAGDAMAWAVSAGIIQGNGAGLNPGGTATRAEVAAILMRFVESGIL